jgi:NAD(P)-dependent dehydrogenase (short-subunit alcohol dehydrogenase family)
MSGWDASRVSDQSGTTVVITGGNSGVGLEAGRVLAARGATVVLACRDPQRAEEARSAISPDGGGRVSTLALDLADLDSVRTAAEKLSAEHNSVDTLVNNAGVMGGSHATTAQGFERQMGTNHIGHFLFTAKVWPLLAAAPAGRVVNVASIASRGGKLDASMTRDILVDPTPYKPNAVYSNTKQANLLFTRELHRRLAAAGSPMRAIAVHPGVSATNLFGRQLREQGMGFLVPIAEHVIMPIGFQSAAMGALPTLRAATDPDVPSGQFVGPTFMRGWRGKPGVFDVFTVGADPATATRLWELTEEIIGEQFPI